MWDGSPGMGGSDFDGAEAPGDAGGGGAPHPTADVDGLPGGDDGGGAVPNPGGGSICRRQ